AVNQARRVFAGQPVFEQRRDVDQRRRVANRVVLMLVMRLVRTDGVIARPLAIVQTLAELKRSFVEGGADGHALFVAGVIRLYRFSEIGKSFIQTRLHLQAGLYAGPPNRATLSLHLRW